jgi:hypothetical protein
VVHEESVELMGQAVMQSDGPACLCRLNVLTFSHACGHGSVQPRRIGQQGHAQARPLGMPRQVRESSRSLVPKQSSAIV